MHAASGGHTRLPKIEFQTFEWCFYNIDAYDFVCNLEIMLKWNELLCSREIVNRHFESKECSCKVLCKFPKEAKISVFVFERRLYHFNIDAYVCNV